jgi:membrane fusion protein (multidrug efflux system)
VTDLTCVQGLVRSAAGITLVAVLLFAGCKDSAPPPAPPPPEVSVVKVTPSVVPESFEFSGEVQPYRRVEVRARVEGVIVARPFIEGSLVKPGQVLYRLEQVRPGAAYRSALARYQNAKRTLDRLEPLLGQHAVAQQDVDNARTDYEASEAALAEAKKDLTDTYVRAEIQGKVGRALMEVGDRVTGPSDLLTTIDPLDPAYVSFQPSVQQLLQWKQNPASGKLIQPGSQLEVQVVMPDGTLLPRTGRLDFVAPALDQTTGTQEFRARFHNPDGLLVPGQFVRVRLLGFTRDSALAVPQRAVQQALGRQFVYVVGKGDTVVSRDVQPGPWSGNLWIIEKGLTPGEQVIVDGIQKATPGRPVHPVALVDTSAAEGTTTRLGAAP